MNKRKSRQFCSNPSTKQRFKETVNNSGSHIKEFVEQRMVAKQLGTAEPSTRHRVNQIQKRCQLISLLKQRLLISLFISPKRNDTLEPNSGAKLSEIGMTETMKAQEFHKPSSSIYQMANDSEYGGKIAEEQTQTHQITRVTSQNTRVTSLDKPCPRVNI